MKRLLAAVAVSAGLAGAVSAQEVTLRAGVFVPVNTAFGEMCGRFVNQLNAELIKALKLPEVEKRMAGFGLDIVISGPEEFGASIRSDYELFARIVKLLDIKPE